MSNLDVLWHKYMTNDDIYHMQNEYLNLVEVCMNFAYELMDLCRGTQEVEAILGEESTETRDPLARLRTALHYNEKKVHNHVMLYLNGCSWLFCGNTLLLGIDHVAML